MTSPPSSPPAPSLQAELFDGHSLLAHPAWLRVSSGTAYVGGLDQAVELEFPVSSLSVSPRVPGAPRYVTLPNAAQLLCADVAWLDSLPGASRSEGPVAWLEHRIWVALFAVLCTVAGVAASYVFVLPRVAEGIVSHISPARERDFGERTLRTFDRNLTRPSAADYEDVREVRQGFKILAAELPPEQSVRLEFRSAGALGANAFALPGGIVVVTDEMLQV